ncbi:hypothetical protein CLIM01_08428 [Colletotrichum limetticola]|uniref:Uncharacterized protein n=1 Tax=Colletotrichum limetticola TaxID=1209924 RepID=A0ABQ9PRR1_9PEZI|nr:hypothetical protein CLIM01_08428 [Colletotrichum limetticola]
MTTVSFKESRKRYNIAMHRLPNNRYECTMYDARSWNMVPMSVMGTLQTLLVTRGTEIAWKTPPNGFFVEAVLSHGEAFRRARSKCSSPAAPGIRTS